MPKKVIEFIPEFELELEEDEEITEENIGNLVERVLSDPTIVDWESERRNMRGIIVDIDGTLANCNHRLHHVTGLKKDWGKFFKDTPKDKPHDWCVRLCQLYYSAGFVIYVVSGRPEEYRNQTESWLEKYGVPYDFLFMRPEGDFREDSIVKRQILRREFPNKDLIEFVVDDRHSVVEMWRDEGLTCLQCNPHD